MTNITPHIIRCWICGVAEPSAAAAIEAAWEDPSSPARQYLAWRSNPGGYEEEHGGPPSMVLEEWTKRPAAAFHSLHELVVALPPVMKGAELGFANGSIERGTETEDNDTPVGGSGEELTAEEVAWRNRRVDESLAALSEQVERAKTRAPLVRWFKTWAGNLLFPDGRFNGDELIGFVYALLMTAAVYLFVRYFPWR